MLKKFIIVFIFVVFCTSSAFAQEDFNDYLKKIKFEVDRAWNAPIYKQRYTSDVYFRVNKNGTISDIKLYRTSKISKLDKIAVETIKNVRKLDKLPSFYESEYIEIVVGLTNFIYQDLRNPNIYQKKKNIEQNNITPVSTKRVKIKKVVYLESFHGESNYHDGMKELVLNREIQKALRN